MVLAHQTLPKPGTVLGDKYRLVRVLGRGGMATVFEAVNEVTHKRVAIKWLHASSVSSPIPVQRVLREARAAARIRHTNVVDIYDVLRHGEESVFLVMELLEGEPLSARLKRELLSVPELLALLLPALRGVAEAHALGVIHRDIKPDNIFLSHERGQAAPVPKVLDFGISKLGRDELNEVSLTASGVALGTPLYMSFEQLNGERALDARVDVYAFGTILYEGLTGRLPFRAPTVGALAIRIASEEPAAPSSLRPTLSKQLDAIVLKALARDREDRFASLNALIAALESLDVEATGKPRVARSRARTIGVLASALAVAGGFGWQHCGATTRNQARSLEVEPAHPYEPSAPMAVPPAHHVQPASLSETSPLSATTPPAPPTVEATSPVARPKQRVLLKSKPSQQQDQVAENASASAQPSGLVNQVEAAPEGPHDTVAPPASNDLPAAVQEQPEVRFRAGQASRDQF